MYCWAGRSWEWQNIGMKATVSASFQKPWKGTRAITNICCCHCEYKLAGLMIALALIFRARCDARNRQPCNVVQGSGIQVREVQVRCVDFVQTLGSSCCHRKLLATCRGLPCSGQTAEPGIDGSFSELLLHWGASHSLNLQSIMALKSY